MTRAEKIALMAKVQIYVAYGYNWADGYYGFRSRSDDSESNNAHRATLDELKAIIDSNLTPSEDWQEIYLNPEEEGCKILGFQIR